MKVVSPHDALRSRAEQGTALILSLLLIFLLSMMGVALLMNSERSRAQVVHNLDNNLATYTALSAIEVASSQIHDFEFNPDTQLTADTAGDTSGLMRSFHFDNPQPAPSEPSGAPGLLGLGGSVSVGLEAAGVAANLNVSLPGSVESNLARVFGEDGSLPAKSAMLRRQDGAFSARSQRLSGGSWLVTTTGKWQREVVEFSVVLEPTPGVPFAVGLYGRESLVLQGPGEVTWINSDDENDIETPVVLEAGEDITVVKTPPPEIEDDE